MAFSKMLFCGGKNIELGEDVAQLGMGLRVAGIESDGVLKMGARGRVIGLT